VIFQKLKLGGREGEKSKRRKREGEETIEGSIEES
jgi:hypothetical protein